MPGRPLRLTCASRSWVKRHRALQASHSPGLQSGRRGEARRVGAFAPRPRNPAPPIPHRRGFPSRGSLSLPCSPPALPADPQGELHGGSPAPHIPLFASAFPLAQPVLPRGASADHTAGGPLPGAGRGLNSRGGSCAQDPLRPAPGDTGREGPELLGAQVPARWAPAEEEGATPPDPGRGL